MEVYSLGQWSAFFAAQVGAAAALAGLVIVAISINIARILSHPLLPGRAAETLVAPTGLLIVSTLVWCRGTIRSFWAASWRRSARRCWRCRSSS